MVPRDILHGKSETSVAVRRLLTYNLRADPISLDDETSRMGTYDFCPPGPPPYVQQPFSGIGHIIYDILPHRQNSNYYPGLTRILDPNNEPNYPPPFITQEEFWRQGP
jgi:hypothetical protein